MRPSPLLPIGAGVGLVGFVLMLFEVVRVLTDSTLGTIGEVLLWVGLGLVVVGALALLGAVVQALESDAPGSHRGEPADG